MNERWMSRALPTKKSALLLGLLVALGVAAGGIAGCGAGYTTTGYGYGYGVRPRMVALDNGLWVVAGYDDPVFYTGDYYWRWYGGDWYRSAYLGGWNRVGYRGVPPRVRRIDRPRRYRHYTPPRRARVRPVPQRHYRPYVQRRGTTRVRRPPAARGPSRRYDRRDRRYDRGYDRRIDRGPRYDRRVEGRGRVRVRPRD